MNKEFEMLYDKVQEVTNEVMMFCGLNKSEDLDYRTNELMDLLADFANNLSNTAHELEEHLAWD